MVTKRYFYSTDHMLWETLFHLFYRIIPTKWTLVEADQKEERLLRMPEISARNLLLKITRSIFIKCWIGNVAWNKFNSFVLLVCIKPASYFSIPCRKPNVNLRKLYGVSVTKGNFGLSQSKTFPRHNCVWLYPIGLSQLFHCYLNLY